MILIALGIQLVAVFSETCPNMCNGHGHCDNADRECECFDGYMGGDCSEYICPFGAAWVDQAIGVDNAHNEAECSNKGTCDRSTGVCSCEGDRFEGQACERRSCPMDCNGRGVCMSMKNFAEEKDAGVGTVYSYESIWDSGMMFGCKCDDGFFGPDCSLRDCPTGDDPLTGTSSDPDGKEYNERQTVECKATDGTFTLTFRGFTTANIPYDASEDELKAFLEALPSISSDYSDGVTVTYSGSLSQACLSGGNQITVEFLQDFGDLPLMVPNGDSLSHFSAATTVTLTVIETVTGSKEDEYCSVRGLCDITTGVCTCMTNWDTSNGYGVAGRRGDCGYATVSITSCPGEITCSGHGVCEGTPTYTCLCSNGWQGTDCSEMVCPSGKSWFSLPSTSDTAHDTEAECSDMGTCDRASGSCTCMEGYEGSACERMSCPGDPACSGNGQCLSMALLAEYAEENGDAADYTYGETPNDPLTWDAEKVREFILLVVMR